MTREQFIDKACHWLVEHSYNSDTQDGITCTSVMTEGTLIEDFRKAMAEKTNPIFEKCLAKVNPETRAEVRGNMEFLDKACEWLEKYMESLGYIDEWCRNGEDDFRKAMTREED